MLQLTSSCGGSVREVVGTSRTGRRTATGAKHNKSRTRAG
ncbi:putative serine protease [Streptomyces viridochromogenes Tue57]|uniref:Putative serine protease n=1 Tax=Streptomyces viridochromogenes Tue57 TaxID=1160705 RepID=L8P7J0_STRVR|nr:putative serine protease [Streptomyces viridochromogenes Tue57]